MPPPGGAAPRRGPPPAGAPREFPPPRRCRLPAGRLGVGPGAGAGAGRRDRHRGGAPAPRARRTPAAQPGRDPRGAGAAGAAALPLPLRRGDRDARGDGAPGRRGERPGSAHLPDRAAQGCGMTPLPVLALVLWATIAGLDLASVLQGLFNRPLLAGAVTGVMLGDPETGLRIGAALELFALDVLPIGASRYGDYGAATVAAVVLGAGQWWEVALGECVLLGLLLAFGGGWSMVLLRRLTMRVVRRAAPALDRGEPGVAVRVHLFGLAADVVRSGILAGVGLAAAADR